MTPARAGGAARTRPRPLSWLLTGSRLASILVMLAGVALVAVVYAPGLMTPDSTDIVRSAKTGNFTDWHSPVIAWLWSFVFHLGVGPLTVLIATVLLLVASTYFLLRPFLPRLFAATVAALLPITPQLIGYVPDHMADTWFTVLFAACFGLCVRAARPGISDRRRVALAGAAVVCTWLAVACRQNGVSAAPAMLLAPLVVSWPVLRPHAPAWLRTQRRARIAALGTCVLVAAGILVSQQLILAVNGTQRLHPEQATQIDDLAAMSLRIGQVLFPPDVYPDQDLELLRQTSTVFNINPLVFGEDPPIRIPITDPAQLTHLRDAWLRAIRDHPLDYLAVRTELWGRQASITGPAYQAVDAGLRPTPIGYDPYFPALVDTAVDYALFWTTDPVRTASGGVLHTVWVYLLIAVVGIVWMARRPSPVNRVLVLLGAGSLLYTLGMFFAATSLQYRYSLPCVYAGMVLAIAVASDWVRTMRRRHGRARQATARRAADQPGEPDLVGVAPVAAGASQTVTA